MLKSHYFACGVEEPGKRCATTKWHSLLPLSLQRAKVRVFNIFPCFVSVWDKGIFAILRPHISEFLSQEVQFKDLVMGEGAKILKEISSTDRKLALAMDPLFNGLHGDKPGKMKTLTEVRVELLKRLEQANA